MNFPQALAVLLALMAVDYITGLAAAVAAKNVESGAAVRGLARKVVIGGAAIVGFLASKAIPDVVFVGVNLGQLDIGSAWASAFALAEAVSILENVSRAGIPLPAAVRIVLSRLKSMDDAGYPVARGDGGISRSRTTAD